MHSGPWSLAVFCQSFVAFCEFICSCSNLFDSLVEFLNCIDFI